jgi:hypothetical protein
VTTDKLSRAIAPAIFLDQDRQALHVPAKIFREIRGRPVSGAAAPCATRPERYGPRSPASCRRRWLRTLGGISCCVPPPRLASRARLRTDRFFQVGNRPGRESMRTLAGQQFIQDRAQRINVAGRADRQALHLFRTGVVRSQHALAILREGPVFLNPGSSALAIPKSNNFGIPSFVVRILRGFRSRLHHQVLMRVLNRFADQTKQAQPLGDQKLLPLAVLAKSARRPRTPSRNKEARLPSLRRPAGAQ